MRERGLGEGYTENDGCEGSEGVKGREEEKERGREGGCDYCEGSEREREC